MPTAVKDRPFRPRKLDFWRANWGIAHNYPQLVEVRELVLGTATNKDIADFAAWVQQKWKKELCPSRELLYDTKMVPVTQQDWIAFSKEGAEEVVLQKGIVEGDL